MVGRAVHGVRTLLAHHSSPAAWGGYKKSGISHEIPLLHQLILIRKKYDLYNSHIFIILRTTCPCAGVMATFERENEWQTQNRSYRLDKCVITEAHAVVKKKKRRRINVRSEARSAVYSAD